MSESLYTRLGKEAARSTAKTKSIKVFKPGGSKAIHDALHDGAQDGRQAPWSYGERRNRFHKNAQSTASNG